MGPSFGLRSYRISKYGQKKKIKKITFKRVIMMTVIFVVLYFALYLIVLPERAYKSVLQEGDRPLIIAHRGGAFLAPENTLVAFERARGLDVDMIELDIRLSKDGHIVVIHDDKVDATTNGEGKVAEMTLDELKKLDAGHQYRDIRGKLIYRGQGITIPTLEEVFQQFGNMRMMIEIKEEADREEVDAIEERLWELIERYNMQNKVIVYSFSKPIMERIQELSQGAVALGASNQEVTRFAALHKLFLHRVYRPQSDVLLIPPEYGLFDLTDQRMIDGAHKLNMKVYYWTINDDQQMRELIQKGANGILTDRPEMMIRVLNEMGY